MHSDPANSQPHLCAASRRAHPAIQAPHRERQAAHDGQGVEGRELHEVHDAATEHERYLKQQVHAEAHRAEMVAGESVEKGRGPQDEQQRHDEHADGRGEIGPVSR